MKTSVDVLIGLLAVKELKIKNLEDRIAVLELYIRQLQAEEDRISNLLKLAKDKITLVKKKKRIGFKKGGNNEKER